MRDVEEHLDNKHGDNSAFHDDCIGNIDGSRVGRFVHDQQRVLVVGDILLLESRSSRLTVVAIE
jgi:hypothetical protein